MNEKIDNLISKYGYNVTDQAGNKLIVVDLEDAKKVMLDFAKKEAMDAFKYGYLQHALDMPGNPAVIFNQKAFEQYFDKRFDE